MALKKYIKKKSKLISHQSRYDVLSLTCSILLDVQDIKIIMKVSPVITHTARVQGLLQLENELKKKCLFVSVARDIQQQGDSVTCTVAWC